MEPAPKRRLLESVIKREPQERRLLESEIKREPQEHRVIDPAVGCTNDRVLREDQIKAEPVEEVSAVPSLYHTLLENLIKTEPMEEDQVMGSVESALLENPIKTEPIEETQVMGSAGNTLNDTLLENPIKTEPIEEDQVMGSVESALLENPIKTEPIEEDQVMGSVESALLENPIKTEPIEETQVMGSAGNTLNDTLLENPIKTEPVDDDEIVGSPAPAAGQTNANTEQSQEPAANSAEAVAQPEINEPEIIFLAKHEPESVRRDHMVKLLIRERTQLSTRHAVQQLLPDPAYFESALSAQGNEYRLIIPDEIDAWAVKVVLMAALNEGVPVDCKSTANGLTLEKLHQAAAFVKVDGAKIGLPALRNGEAQPANVAETGNNMPEPGNNLPGVPEGIQIPKNLPPAVLQPPAKPIELWDLQYRLQEECGKPDFLQLPFVTILDLVKKGFLDVASELTVYEAVLKWCKHSYPSRWTKDMCDALFVEIRWDLLENKLDLAIMTESAPLRDTLQDLKTAMFPAGRLTVQPRERHFTQSLYLLFADGNQVHLKRYDWETDVNFKVLPPQEMLHWTPHCEILPGWNPHSLFFRVVNGRYLRTYSYDLKLNVVRYLFEQQTDNGDGCPLVCLNGTIYVWSSKSSQSLRFHPENSTITHGLSKPKSFRKEAAFASWKGKFYYCGGALLKDKSGAAVATVEVYDAGRNKWSALPDMQEPRRCFAALVCNGFLYVTGGALNDDPGIHASCERLNLCVIGAEWETIEDLNEPRYNHVMFEINGQVHVSSGYTSRGKSARDMEYYNENGECWEDVDVEFGCGWTSCVKLTRDYNFSL